MSDIIIRDANNVSQVIRTFSDATSVHNNASVPINVSGLPIFVTAAPGIVAGVVSVTPEGGNFPVSVAGQVSLAPQTLVVSGSVGLSGPLPAGTLHLGKVSVEGLTIGAGSGLTVSVGGAVSAQAVPAGFSDGTNYRIPYADSAGVQRVSVQGTVSISDKVSVAGIVGIQAGTAHIGRVSVVPDGTGSNFPVSVAGTVNVSLGDLANNLPVSVAGTVNVSIGALANNLPVSIGGVFTGTNIDGQGTINSLFTNNQNKVFNKGSSTWDRMVGTSLGLLVTGSVGISGPLPAGTNHLGKVSVEGLTVAVSIPPISGGTQTVSVGGPVSVQAVQIAGRDSAGNARSPLMHTDGALVVHISAGGGAAGGGGPTVSVGGATSVQAVPVAGEDINGIVRLLKTAIDGTLKTSSYMTSPSYAFSRPTDTVTYAAGDLVANSTVAGTVVPLSWPAARLTNAVNTLSIRRARITKTGLNITNAAYRLHIFTTATGVSVSTGDNRVFTSVWSPASKYAGAVDFIIDRPGKDGSFGDGTVANGSELNIVLTSGMTSISGLLEARGAYVPLSGETFTVTLEMFQD